MTVIANSAKMKVLELYFDCVWSQELLAYDYAVKYYYLQLAFNQWTFLFHMDI
jgi:hypothetical protein